MIPLNIMMQLGIKTEKILFFLTMQILRYDVKKMLKKYQLLNEINLMKHTKK